MDSFPVVRVDTAAITDWDSFHEVFSTAFGFPAFYGRNLDAWIDCMSDLDGGLAGMTTVQVPPGGVLVLQLDNVLEFQRRCPGQYAAIVEGAAFVNWRRIEQGEPPVLALSFHR